MSFQGIITEVSADILHRVGLQFIFHLFLILYNGMIAAVIIPVPPTMYYIHLHTLQHDVKSLARFSKIILHTITGTESKKKHSNLFLLVRYTGFL